MFSATHPRSLYPVLTLAGAIPFVVGSVLSIVAIEPFPFNITSAQLVSTYGLLIISFMAGVHWGQHLYVGGDWEARLPVLSNLLALLAWASFLLLDFKALCLVLAVGFGLLLLIDQRLHKDALITAAYLRVRTLVTGVVVSCLLATAAFS